MIKVDFWLNGFIANGHACADVYGQDLVCAAVSAIIQGALSWFSEEECILDYGKDGFISLKCHTNLHNNEFLLSLIYKQLKAVEQSLNQNQKYLLVNWHKGFNNEL